MDEQAGERCHKRYKHARTHLARKTNPEDNLLDVMRQSLTWSDLKMSHLEFYQRTSYTRHEKDKNFGKLMTQYYADFDGEGADDDDASSGAEDDSDNEGDDSDSEDEN